MLRVTSQRDPFSQIERSITEWGIGCTARRLAPSWADPDFTSCSRNGALVTDWDALFADGDHVHYWTRPGAGPIGAILGSTVFSYITNKLLLPKEKPTEAETPSHSFSGLAANARGDGLAIPVLYGRLRVTPPIINEYIRNSLDSNGVPVSEYLALMLVSEGPIKSIGDKTADGGPFTREAGTFLQTLQINGQPAENFEGVEAHVRLGNLEQTAIAELVDPVISRDVGLTMHEPETLTDEPTPLSGSPTISPTTAIATPGKFAAANVNITKWDTEPSLVSFIGQDTADEFTVVINFPQGLIEYDAGGAPLPHEVIYQIRYVEVDGGGTPFGDYIVLAARQIQLQRESQLIIEDRQRTYLPSAYQAPSTGQCVSSNAVAQGNPGVSVFADTSKIAAQATGSVKFSVSMWIRRRNLQAINTTNRVFMWRNAGGTAGFWINFVRGPSGSPSAACFCGTAGGQQSYASSIFGGSPALNDTAVWHHFVVTYEANFDGNNNARGRVYIDGVLNNTLAPLAAANGAVWDPSQIIRIGSDSETAPTLGYDGLFDGVYLFDKVLSAYDVAGLFMSGVPVGIDPATPGFLIGGEFDTAVGVNPNAGSPSFGPAAFTSAPASTWRNGTGNPATSTNPIITTGAIVKIPLTPNFPHRSKWRVDVLRLDTEDTNTRFRSEMEFASIQWRTFEDFQYPGMALLAVKILATDQLSGNAPTLSVIAEGRTVPVWDGADLISPNMPESYSQSPAWVAADMALNRDYGIGDLYNNVDLDVGQFDALADLSGARIYDNMTRMPLVSARQIDGADTGTDPNMAIVAEDCVRYRVDRLPSNFPGITAGKVSTGKYMTCLVTGTPSPSVPSWLDDEIDAGAQEAIFVAFDAASGDFFIYCKSSVPAGTSALYTPSNTATDRLDVQRNDVRFRYDGYFDGTDVDAWDALTQVLQTARASPMRLGSRLSVSIDDVATPTALIGMGSIIEGTWRQTFQDVRERPNAESAEFFDEDRNYERDSQPDEHPELVNPANEAGFVWRRMRLDGITRRGQIKRYLRRDLNTYFLVRRFVEFELGIDGLAAIAGDVIAISHDVPGYGISGRIWEDGTTTSIKLDRAVTLLPATSYQIQIENVASEVRETRAVTSPANTYPAGAAISVTAFSFAPDKDDEFALGTVAQGEVKLFRISESTLNPRMLRRRVKASEYVEAVYDDDFGTLPEVTTTNLPAPSAPSVPPGVENLSVTELTVKGPDGSVRIGATVAFTHFPETYHAVGWTDVYIATGDHTLGLGAARLAATLSPTDVSFDLSGQNFARNQTYTIWVVPKTRDGATAYRSFASFAEFTPSGLAEPPNPPAGVSAVVTGDFVTYYWTDPGDLDQGATVEARQGGWLLGLVIGSWPAQARSSGPLSVWNSAPSNEFGVAETAIYFRTKLKTGQYSAEATELVYAPSVPSADGEAFEASEEANTWGTT